MLLLVAMGSNTLVKVSKLFMTTRSTWFLNLPQISE